MVDLSQKLESLGILKDCVALFMETEFVAKPEGLAGLGEESKAIIKVYSMNSEQLEESFIKDAKHYLESWIKKLTDPLTGLGYAIISHEFLNISLWNNGIPHLPVNNVFNFSAGFDYDENVTSEGAYCAGELAIATHEAYFWLQYLRSEKSVEDKIKYLRTFIEGPLLVPSEERIRWESREPDVPDVDLDIPI